MRTSTAAAEGFSSSTLTLRAKNAFLPWSHCAYVYICICNIYAHVNQLQYQWYETHVYTYKCCNLNSSTNKYIARYISEFQWGRSEVVIIYPDIHNTYHMCTFPLQTYTTSSETSDPIRPQAHDRNPCRTWVNLSLRKRRISWYPLVL